jgi:hypothetical protein
MQLKDLPTYYYLNHIEKYGKRYKTTFVSYTRKIVLTGDRVKYYHYSKPIYKNLSKPNDNVVYGVKTQKNKADTVQHCVQTNPASAGTQLPLLPSVAVKSYELQLFKINGNKLSRNHMIAISDYLINPLPLSEATFVSLSELKRRPFSVKSETFEERAVSLIRKKLESCARSQQNTIQTISPVAIHSDASATQRSVFSLTRTRNNLFDTIETNKTAFTKILTLTTRTPVLDRKEFLHKFKIFRRRFEKYFQIKLKYIGIIEQQKERGKKENNSGSLHAHLILFIDDYLPFIELKRLWQTFGSIDIKKVQFHGYAKYLAKYLTKSNIENIHQLGKKSIFKSQHLKKPRVFYDQPINSPLHDKFTGEVVFNKKLYRVLSSSYRMHDESLTRYYEYSTIKPDRKKTK